MKKELIEPEHRCKCGTPLEFQHNYMRDNKEIDKIFNKRFLEKIVF